MSHPVNYLIREAVTRTPGPFRGTKIIGKYSFSGIQIEMHHGTSDHSIFGEIFATGLYNPPPEVDRVLPKQCLRILDLGGHVGWFALFAALRYPSSSSLLGFEADAGNYLRYKKTFHSIGRDWTVRHAFAAAESGTVAYTSDHEAFGTKVEDGVGPTVESVDILPLISDFDPVKMDIEGGEWEILTDPRFSCSIGNAIVLEYHPRLCPGPDARLEAERVLRTAGLKTIPVVHNEEGGYGMMWGYRVSG